MLIKGIFAASKKKNQDFILHIPRTLFKAREKQFPTDLETENLILC